MSVRPRTLTDGTVVYEAHLYRPGYGDTYLGTFPTWEEAGQRITEQRRSTKTRGSNRP